MLSNKLTLFFFHVACEFALRKGWDMESELTTFHATNGTDLSTLYATVTTAEGLEFNITESDILQASQGVATEGFKAFWKGITLVEDAPDDGIVLSSMHSGSSDYLYVKDVKEIQAL